MINRDLFQKSIHFLSSYLADNQQLYQELQQIYQKEKFRFYKAAVIHPQYEHPLITHGSLEREIKIKQVLGLLICAEEDEQLRVKLLKAVTKIYPYEINIEKMNNMLLKLFDSPLPNFFEKSCGLHAVAYYKIWLRYGNNSTLLPSLQAVVDSTEDLLESSQKDHSGDIPGGEPIEFSEALPFIKEHEKRFERFQKCQEMPWLHDYDKVVIPGGVPDNFLPKNKELLVQFVKTNAFIESIFSIQDLFGSYITESISLSKDELRYIFIKMIEAYAEYKDDLSLFPENQVIHFYVFGIYIQTILKAYKNVKVLYRKTNQETQYLELERLQEENKDLKQKIIKLENENNKFKTELESNKTNLKKSVVDVEKHFHAKTKDLEDENLSLLKELEKNKTDFNELYRLREFVFSLESEETLEPSETKGFSIPTDKRVIIIGGHENWRKKIKAKYPSLNLIDGTNNRINLEICRSADIALFFTPHMSHAVYEKYIGYFNNNNINYGYVNQSNLTLFEHQLQKAHSDQ